MTYNSIIQLKGVQKPIITSRENALAVQQMFNDSKKAYNAVITIGTQSFIKGDIKYVEVNNDGDDSRKNDMSMKAFYEEEHCKYTALLAKPVEYRAGLLDAFFYFYKIAMKEEPSKEILDKAYQIQLQFFKEHPKRTLCDLYLLKTLISHLNYSTPSKLWEQSSLMLAEAYFRLIEKAVFRDMQLAGQLNTEIKPKPLKEIQGNETIEDLIAVAEENRNIDKEFTDAVSEAVHNF